MDFPRLRLWQEAALRPGDCAPNPWVSRHREPTTGGAAPDEEMRRSLRRSRDAAKRARAAALYGLLLTTLLALPTSLVFGYSTALALRGGDATQCIRVSGMLDGALQRGLQQYRSIHGLSSSETALLNAEVCDPLLKSIVPSLVANITSGIDVDQARRNAAGRGMPGQSRSAAPGAADGWSMLRAVVGSGAQ